MAQTGLVEGCRRAPLSSRQTEIRDQLLKLFLAEGFADLTLDAIARRLGCSKATLYTLAESKEQMVVGVIRLFFERAAAAIDQTAAAARTPEERIAVYLRATADELHAASARFMADMNALTPARRIYELNTRIAARKVREMIEQGVAGGSFRPVNAAFVGEVVAATIVRIHHGEIAKSCNSTDVDAFTELANIVLRGVTGHRG